MPRALMIHSRIRPSLVWGCAVIWLGLSVTGVWWWWDQDQQMNDPQVWAVGLIKSHGMLAYVAVLLVGMLLSTHVRAGWQRRRHWAMPVWALGLLSLALLGGLMITGLGLYYASMELREWMHRLHVWVGFAAVLLLPLHAVVGRSLRRRRSARSA